MPLRVGLLDDVTATDLTCVGLNVHEGLVLAFVGLVFPRKFKNNGLKVLLIVGNDGYWRLEIKAFVDESLGSLAYLLVDEVPIV